MKKVLIGFASFIFLLGGFAILIPFLVDINDYKPQILAKAKEALGRNLKIDGNLQFRLLPQVKITLENVQLANAETGSQPAMASVEKIHLKLALWPLLKKKVNIYKIEMIKPTVFLEKLPNGHGNWEFHSLTSSTHRKNDLKDFEDNTLSSSKNFDIKIQSFKMTDGSFQYKDGKVVHTLDHITSEIQLDSIQGPVHAKGDLSYGAQSLNFEVDLGKFDKNQLLSARFESGNSHLEMKGKIQNTNFQGHIQTDIDFAQFEKIFGIKLALPSTLGTKAVIMSDIITTEKNIRLDHFNIKANQLDTQGAFIIDYNSDVKIQGTLENLPGASHLTITSHPTSQAHGGDFDLQITHMKQLLEFLQQDTTAISKQLLGKSSLKLQYNITPTAIYFNNVNLNLAATVLKGEFILNINIPKPSLTMNLKTENILPILILAGMPAKPDQKMSGLFNGKIAGDMNSFAFDTQTQLGRTVISAQGQGQRLNNQMNITSDLHFKSASFVNFAEQFGLQISNIFNQTSIDGNIVQNASRAQLDTSIQAGELILQTKGTIDTTASSPQVNLNISASHPNLKQLLGRLGASTTAPSGNFSLDGHLEGSPATTLTMTSLKGKLGSAGSFKGTIGYKAPIHDKKPYISAVLSFPTINLENFWAFTNYAVTTPAFSNPQIILAAAPSPTKSPWSHEKLDLQFLDSIEADIKIDADLLKKDDLIFDNVSFAALIKQAVLHINEVKAKFYGGQFDLKGQTDAKQNNASRYQFSLKGAELKNLSPKQGSIKITNGRMDIVGDLQTNGTSIYGLVERLQGKIKFHAQDGILSGFNLQALTRNLTKQNRLEGLSHLFQTSFKQGQTPFSSFDGYLDIQQGTGHLKDVKLVAKGAEGTAQGSLDLPAYQMNVTAQFVLTDLKNIPPFGVQLTGPLDAPVRSIKSASLEKFITQNISDMVGDAVKSGKLKPKDLLNSFLGKNTSGDPEDKAKDSSASETSHQSPSTSKPQSEDLTKNKDLIKNPEKALKGLLKGFL